MKSIVYRCGPYIVTVTPRSTFSWSWSIVGGGVEIFSVATYRTPGRALEAAFAALPIKVAK